MFFVAGRFHFDGVGTVEPSQGVEARVISPSPTYNSAATHINITPRFFFANRRVCVALYLEKLGEEQLEEAFREMNSALRMPARVR